MAVKLVCTMGLSATAPAEARDRAENARAAAMCRLAGPAREADFIPIFVARPVPLSLRRATGCQSRATKKVQASRQTLI